MTEKSETSDKSLIDDSRDDEMSELSFSECMEADETDISLISEINESNWVESARDTLNQYYNRGGTGSGDIPQLLSPSELINSVGYALSIVPNVDPTKWDKDHLEMAYEGKLTYYENKALEAIEKITKKMTKECHDSREIYLTILPISFYFNKSFYTLPLFRFKRMKDDKDMYIDNIARVYKSFHDWHENNRLPACQIYYPKDGKLTISQETNEVDFELEESAESKRPVKTLLACDILYGTMGILGGIGATIATGGAALAMMGAVGLSASYGAGRSALKLRDRAKHKETINPFHNKDAFFLWLGISFDVLTFGTIGAASTKFVSGISTISTVGHKITTGSRISQVMSALHGASKGLDGAGILVTGFKVFEEIKHKDKLKAIPASVLLKISGSEEFDEINMLLMSVTTGFWSRSKMTYCSPEQFKEMVKEQILQSLTEQCESPEMLSKISNFIQNDHLLIELFKHLGLNLTIQESVEFLHDLIVNEKKMEVKFDLGEKLIVLDDMQLPFEILSTLNKQELCTIMHFLFKLDVVEKNNLMEIRNYLDNDKDLFKLLAVDGKSLMILSTLYDIFALTFHEKLLQIDGELGEIFIGPNRFSVDLLANLSKEERRYFIIKIARFDEENNKHFQEFRENFQNDEELLRILGSGEENSILKEKIERILDDSELKDSQFLKDLDE